MYRAPAASAAHSPTATRRTNVFAAIDDVADCAKFLSERGFAEPHRIACAGWSYGGYLTLAALTFHPELFAAGVSICGMSDLNTFYRNTEAWIAAAAHPESTGIRSATAICSTRYHRCNAWKS